MAIDLNFMDAGCEDGRGGRFFLVLTRRALRRLLRPILMHLTAILGAMVERLDEGDRVDRALQGRLDELERRHDELTRQTQSTIAFGWDYVALVRRLAALEDRVGANSPGGPHEGRESPHPVAPIPTAELC